MANFDPPVYASANSYTVNDLIYAGYRKARALKHPGQGVSPSEQIEGLQLLNAMVDGMRVENLLVIYTRRMPFDVVASQKTYSIGSSLAADFNTERPEHIPRAGFILTPSAQNEAEVPMEIILSFERWQLFVAKNTQSNVPLVLYYEPSVPLGNCRFWPVPNIGSQIVLYIPQILTEFSTVDDPLYMPNGYREMLEYGLACRVHELYPDRPWDANIEVKAEHYKKRVKASQTNPNYVRSDEGAMQGNRAPWYGGNPRAWTPYTGY